MATIQKRGNSYLIRVSCGYNAKGKQILRSLTWKPDKNYTKRQLEKELNRQAIIFEEKCNGGYQSTIVKFETFAEEWFREFAKPNLRNTTYERMLGLRKRVSGALRHSTVSTTGNIYCHMLDQAQARVSSAVSEALKLT